MARVVRGRTISDFGTVSRYSGAETKKNYQQYVGKKTAISLLLHLEPTSSESSPSNLQNDRELLSSKAFVFKLVGGFDL